MIVTSFPRMHTQNYKRLYGEFERIIFAHFDDLQLVDNELATNWYTGENQLQVLSIYTNRLDRIHANAFNASALQNLWHLTMDVEHGAVHICDGAFDGLHELETIQFHPQDVMHMPAGLFDAVHGIICVIQMSNWPSEINLNEMFSNAPFTLLNELEIRNVRMPQTKFRILAAANITTFRRLFDLTLFNCGIEVIEPHAFDAIASTLEFINLENNWIKFIDLDMFRKIYETKNFDVDFGIYSDKVPLACTCALLEMDVLLFPFRRSPAKMCFLCKVHKKFNVHACGIHRIVDPTRLGIVSKAMVLLIIDFRLAHADGMIAIQTNFSSTFRMIIGDLNGMGSGWCAMRAKKSNFKCFSADKFIDDYNLNEIEEIRQAEFVSITAIPILYRFGARPLHSITVRQPIIRHPDCLIDVGVLIVSVVLGSFIGFLVGSLRTAIAEDDPRHIADQTETIANASTFECEYVYNEIQSNANRIAVNARAVSNDDSDVEYYDQFEQEALPNIYM